MGHLVAKKLISALLAVLLIPSSASAITGDHLKSILYDTPFYDPNYVGGPGPCGFGDIPLEGADSIQKGYNYFVSKGLEPYISAAIIGNFRQESQMSTTAVNPLSGAYGIAQWLGSRQDALFTYAQLQGVDKSDLGIQLGYAWEELSGGPHAAEDDKHVIQHMIESGTIEGATTIFANEYERAGDHEENIQQRIIYAQEVLAEYGGGTAPGLVDGGCGSVPSGTASELAAQLLGNPNVTLAREDVRIDLQNTVDGKPGTAGVPMDQGLLQVLVGLAQNHTFWITALQDYGTGHSPTSNHYEGKAADIGPTGSTTYDQMNTYLFQNNSTYNLNELIFDPMPSGVTTLRGGEPFNYSAGVISDHRDHIHVSVK